VALCSLIESKNIRRNLLPASSEEKKQRYTYRQKRTETLSPVVQYHIFLLVHLPFFRAVFSFTLKMEVELSSETCLSYTRHYFPGDRDLDVSPVRNSTLVYLVTSHLQKDRLVNKHWNYEGGVFAVAGAPVL
jgi:hypothetical protein